LPEKKRQYKSIDELTKGFDKFIKKEKIKEADKELKKLIKRPKQSK